MNSWKTSPPPGPKPKDCGGIFLSSSCWRSDQPAKESEAGGPAKRRRRGDERWRRRRRGGAGCGRRRRRSWRQEAGPPGEATRAAAIIPLVS
jgi:hypothetical protein